MWQEGPLDFQWEFFLGGETVLELRPILLFGSQFAAGSFDTKILMKKCKFRLAQRVELKSSLFSSGQRVRLLSLGKYVDISLWAVAKSCVYCQANRLQAIREKKLIIWHSDEGNVFGNSVEELKSQGYETKINCWLSKGLKC